MCEPKAVSLLIDRKWITFANYSGAFRLQFNFIDLSTANQSLLTSGSAPVLSSVFSDAFSVYSAKRGKMTKATIAETD